MKKDIVIAGGGAAGSMAAWFAAEQNFNVTLVEEKNRTQYHPCSGVYPLHSLKGFPPLPDSVFERDMVTMKVISPKNAALIDAREFRSTLGKVILRSRFDAFMLDAAEKKGAEILDRTRVKKIELTRDYASLHVVDANGVESIVMGDVLLLATGASGLHFHAQLGIEKPPVVETIIGEFESSEDHVENVLSSGAYHYYVNKKVTSIGPFWITCRKDTFNAGIIDFKVSKERFIDTMKKDPRVKYLFEGAREKIWPGQASPFTTTLIPCGPIKTPYGNRFLVLGDAAGITHPFYYEGVWEARCCAKHAIETLAKIRAEHKAPTSDNLAEYKKTIARNIVNTFLRSGRKNSWLFWQALSDETLWYYFCEALQKSKNLRELIVKCFEVDYATSSVDWDFKAGEMIFQSIPTLKKILYAPYFLKAGSIK